VLVLGGVLVLALSTLKVKPIHCVRGLKSSLVIGQKAKIGLNPFTPRGRADLKNECVTQKMHGLTWHELVELGAPKMEGQFLALGPMPYFNYIYITKYNFFQRTRLLDYVEI
jgi:hypothetical protein